MTHVIDALLERSSEPRLTAPAPDQALLDTVFECAARAPDHALLRPWRYLVIEGDGIESLGELFASAASDPHDPLSTDRDKLLRMPQRAPMLIVGICSHRPHPKVPEQEQIISAGVGLGYILLALQSAGFGAMWRTGAVAHHPAIRRGLGVGDDETIVGFLYVGTVDSAKPAVPRPTVDEFVSRWPA